MPGRPRRIRRQPGTGDMVDCRLIVSAEVNKQIMAEAEKAGMTKYEYLAQCLALRSAESIQLSTRSMSFIENRCKAEGKEISAFVDECVQFYERKRAELLRV